VVVKNCDGLLFISYGMILDSNYFLMVIKYYVSKPNSTLHKANFSEEMYLQYTMLDRKMTIVLYMLLSSH